MTVSSANRFKSSFTNGLAGIIVGLVSDSNGAGIPGATISIAGSTTIKTLSNGRYFTLRSPEVTQLAASAAGFLPSDTVNVTVSSGKVATQTFTLASAPAVNGVCGSAAGGSFATAPASNLCNSGVPQPVTGNSGTRQWNWNCTGSNGGSPAICTASQQVASKPGDCDGDGTVTIAEVQSAINMYLGVRGVASCVDLDNSGVVSLSEMQKTINAFLGR